MNQSTVVNDKAEMNKLMIMAGGTGGHVFPALAVANALREKNTQVTWLGTLKGLEASVIPANNIEIEWISVEGLRGKGIFSWLLAPFKIVCATVQSMQVIRKIKPDCVLGMGGFVSGPGGLASRILGKPLVIHEQNAVVGLTNKYLAKIANQVLTGFPDTANLPVSAKWVGNPVRDSIKPNNPNTEAKINVLVIGGSQGAHSLNKCLPALFSVYKADINVWHQTGKNRSDEVVKEYQTLDMPAKVTEFIDDMSAAYQWADLLVCRAGAMTIAECCAAAKPALLIPYPFSAGDHQLKNAQVMADVDAALIVSNQTLNESSSLPELNQLLASKAKLSAMGKRAFELHKPNALLNLITTCEKYLHA